MANSINKIDLLFKSIFDAHPAIQGRYRMGPDLDLSSNELDYPRIHIVPQTSSINGNVIVHTLYVMCVDIAKQDDNQMVKEVWSDTHQVLEDLVKFIRGYNGDDNWFDIINNPITQTILEDYRDRFTGHGMTLNLEVDLTGPCDVPIFNPDICGFVSKHIPPGPIGPTGSSGTQGFQGPQGFQGFQGFQGSTGSQGIDGSNSLRWEYVSGTNPPDVMNFIANIPDFNYVTTFHINYQNLYNISASDWLDEIRIRIEDGNSIYLKVTSVSDPTKYGIYNVTDVVDQSTYYDIDVELLSSSGGFISDGIYSISYVYNGSSGSTGLQGFQGNQGIQGIDGANALRWLSSNRGPVPPTTNTFSTDTNNLDTLSRIYIHDNNYYGVDCTLWLRAISTAYNDSDKPVQIKITRVDQPEIFGVYNVEDIAEVGVYFTISVSLVESYGGSIGDLLYSVSYVEFGAPGSNGVQGFQGRQGSIGITGLQGFQGRQGFQGIGSNGSTGIQGFQGYQGSIGSTTVNTLTGTTYSLLQSDSTLTTTINRFNNAASIVLTIPANSSTPISVGSRFDCSVIGAGQLTVTPGGGVTVNSFGSWYKTAGQYAPFTLIKTATDTWFLSGVLIP